MAGAQEWCWKAAESGLTEAQEEIALKIKGKGSPLRVAPMEAIERLARCQGVDLTQLAMDLFDEGTHEHLTLFWQIFEKFELDMTRRRHTSEASSPVLASLARRFQFPSVPQPFVVWVLRWLTGKIGAEALPFFRQLLKSDVVSGEPFCSS